MSNNIKECCELRCAKCIIASKEACDAPVINQLINTVYTVIPNFSFPENGLLVMINGSNEYCFNYYISLPCESCDEIRLLWPITWLIPQLIQKLQGKFTGTGNIIVKFLLNILAKRIIKAPAQSNSTLNTGNVINGPCICNSSTALYDYTFNFAFTSGSPSSTLSLILPSTLSFSAPNNPIIVQFVIDPITYNLIPQNQVNLLNLAVSTIEGFGSSAFLGGLEPVITSIITHLGATSSQLSLLPAFLTASVSSGITGVTISGTTVTLTNGTETYTFLATNIITAVSPAQYISFVFSCNKDNKNNNNDHESYWTATNL